MPEHCRQLGGKELNAALLHWPLSSHSQAAKAGCGSMGTKEVLNNLFPMEFPSHESEEQG